jgi:hypothetical protein
MHVIHLSEAFEHLQWRQVIFVVCCLCLRETLLVLLDVAKEEELVQVSLTLEVQIAEAGGDGQTRIFHLYCPLHV